MACEADLSEVEQQQEPLAAKEETLGPRQGLTLRKSVAVAAGVLLLGAAALALYARPSTALGTAGAATRQTADLIQAFALKKNGRTLTQEELTKVQHHIDNAKFHGMALTAMAGGAFKPRSLHEETEVSEKCDKALEEMGNIIFDRGMGYAMEAFAACGEDRECSECKKAQAKLEGFEDELKAQCKSSGHYCTVTEVEDDEKEEETVCLPKECHDEPDLAAEFMEDEAHHDEADLAAKYMEHEAHHEEGHEHCDDCTVTVTCGDDED